MRAAIAFAVALSVLPTPAFSSEPIGPVKFGLSATKARDINGFALGMAIQEATARSTVTFRQGELIQATLNGIEYDFGVCPSGRIYRIQSRQKLGNFIPDEVFTAELKSKLFAKYGATNDESANNLSWDLIESVRYSDGNTGLFKTNWLSILVSGGHGGPLSLDMTMLDFRICWEDKVRMNEQPRDQASEAIVF